MKKLALVLLLTVLTSCAYKAKQGDCIQLTAKETGATATLQILGESNGSLLISFGGLPVVIDKKEFENQTNIYMKKNETPFSAKKVKCE